MSATDYSDLSFTATVPRQLVHRSAICEVFLTDSAFLGEDAFVLATQLPRVHSYYSDHTSSPAAYDPLLLMECCRQGAVYLAHRYWDVSTDNKFILNESEIRITDPAALIIGAHPGHAILRAKISDRKHREETLVGFSLHVTVSVDGREAAEVDIAIQWMPSAAWDKLRDRGRAALALPQAPAPQPSRRLAPASVARLSERNVLLGDVAVTGMDVTAGVVVDQAHPGLFDHPLDHVPGMLLFEALRQTAIVSAHELLGLSPSRLSAVACQGQFIRFAEFELPTVCRAELAAPSSLSAGLASVEITASQGDTPVAIGTVQLKTTSALEPAWLYQRSGPVAELAGTPVAAQS